MIEELIYTFLLSLSPFGEGRVGIPFGITNGLSVGTAFVVGLIGNLLIFPVFYYLITIGNRYLWQYKSYKKGAIYLAKRAKRLTGKNMRKYGVWGLMVFVMIPLPVTGAYVGTIAAYLMSLSYKKSFLSISSGVIIALSIITGGASLFVDLF